MKRAPDTEDLRLWAVVAATVRPIRPSSLPFMGRDSDAERRRVGEAGATTNAKPAKSSPAAAHPHPGAARLSLPMKGREVREAREVEAGLQRRLARGRERLAARVDLHGMTQDSARVALTRFIERSAAEGWRAVLVITGKGTQGDGVLRRRVPDWLGEPPLAARIAGFSEAHRRHGGEGALYVALKRGS